MDFASRSLYYINLTFYYSSLHHSVINIILLQLLTHKVLFLFFYFKNLCKYLYNISSKDQESSMNHDRVINELWQSSMNHDRVINELWQSSMNHDKVINELWQSHQWTMTESSMNFDRVINELWQSHQWTMTKSSMNYDRVINELWQSHQWTMTESYESKLLNSWISVYRILRLNKKYIWLILKYIQ